MSDKTNNQTLTLNTYEQMAQHYIDRTPTSIDGDYKQYLDNFLASVSKDAKILEIGSAVGTDADYIESKGYGVTRTDVVNAFLQYQRNKGKCISRFNVLEDRLHQYFDLIIASAVFLHFDLQQFDQAVVNVKNHLEKNGHFALAMKKGRGEEYTSEKMESPRYFRYWTEPELATRLHNNGFSADIATGSDNKWLYCLATLNDSQ